MSSSKWKKCPGCGAEDYESRLHEPYSTACFKRQAREHSGKTCEREDYYKDAKRNERLCAGGRGRKNCDKVKAALLSKGGTLISPGKSCRLGEYIARADTMDDYVVQEVSSYRPLLDDIRSGDILLDAGGCVGSIAVEAAMRGARVHTVEPCEANATHLIAHSQMNSVRSKITLHQALLSPEKGNDRRILYESSGSNKGSHSTQIAASSQRVAKTKCTLTPSKLMSKIRGRVSLLKIDVEGDEYTEGWFDDLMASIDLRNLRCVAIELHLFKKGWSKKASAIAKYFAKGPWRLIKKPILNNKKLRHTMGIWKKGRIKSR